MQFGQRNAEFRCRARADEVVTATDKIEAINDVLAGRKQRVEQGIAFNQGQSAALIHLAAGTAHCPSCHPPARQRRSSSEFDTTETELMAIAAPAITGLSIPKAASGIPRTL